ncbi:unnamed protein product, partial [Gongylonema pulchrum]|uniref:DUF3134 domain-containing protein n=1 Tax=Gongylonema pulchrum TaxID=637853 RepID=A0A183CZU1_9BILA
MERDGICWEIVTILLAVRERSVDQACTTPRSGAWNDAECNRDLTGQPVMQSPKASSRFAFAYFVYSPPSPIPAELKALPVNIFKIPAQVDKLISWLHNQPLNVPLDIHADISQLQSAINEFLQYRRENPAWLAERLQLMHEGGEPEFDPHNIPVQIDRPVLTVEEQRRLAEAMNLEPPDTDSSVEDPRFALIGSPDDSDDSAS